MKKDAPIELAALIGIDWADQQHDVSLQAAGSTAVEHARVRHTAEALTEWLNELRQRFNGKPVGIAVETSRGPLVHALLDYEFVVLYPVNPRSLQRFRETFTPSGAKDDLPDADLLRELLVKHRARLRAWEPDDPQTRTLRRLVEDRRKMVDLGTRLTQQLRAALKEYYPQALSWAGDDLTTALACDFLLHWPTLESVQRARPKTIRKFYYAHNCRSADRIEERIRSIQNAKPLTRDPAIVQSSTLLVQTLAGQLKALRPRIARYDEEIKQRFAAHEDADLFDALPGSGAALAPRLLAIFGSNRDRFQNAAELQKLSGIAPVTQRSGQRSHVHWRWAASTFIRQTFHEFAHHSIRHSAWARAYYDLQRQRGKGHHAAVRALAFKWIRVIWRCWKNRTPYDETRYMRTLAQRGSPLVAQLSAAA
jgi:transposase